MFIIAIGEYENENGIFLKSLYSTNKFQLSVFVHRYLQLLVNYHPLLEQANSVALCEYRVPNLSVVCHFRQ